jgi:hypothetical protein
MAARASTSAGLSNAVTLLIDDAAPDAAEVLWPNVMRVSPLRALTVLAQPLYLIVEDESSDGAFILWMSRLFGRDVILRAYNAGRLVFRHAGGKTQLVKSARALTFGVWPRNNKPILSMRLRAIALLDSDSRFPGDSPNVSIRDAVAQYVASAHILSNRAIENYVPYHYFSRRLKASHSESAIQAYFRMSPSQRSHFPLKKGFRGSSTPSNPQTHDEFLADLRWVQEEKDHFRSVDAAGWQYFSGGFGDVLADVYQDEKYRCEPNKTSILTPDQRTEIAQLLSQIITYL